MKDNITEMLEEAVKIYFETGNSRYAINKAKEMYKEKDHLAPDQSMQNDPNEITFKDIVPLGTDIDNNEIYDIETGETIKEF